jgi:hypothetical protein
MYEEWQPDPEKFAGLDREELVLKLLEYAGELRYKLARCRARLVELEMLSEGVDKLLEETSDP